VKLTGQIWLLPISLALGLFSFTFIADHFPKFGNWLNDHTKAKSLLTTTLPTILVSVISFVVPTLLNQITMAAQNIFMTSRLHDTIMRRYWRVASPAPGADPRQGVAGHQCASVTAPRVLSAS